MRLETLAKSEVADALLVKQVERITFDFHLPYLLREDCPFNKGTQGPGSEHIEFTFADAEKTIVYNDKHELKAPYTLIRVTMSWDHPRPQLKDVMAEPLTVLTEFPLRIVNGLLASYQLLTGDYAGRHLGSMELEYVPGEIWLIAENNPLKVTAHHWRSERDKDRPSLESDMWLYYSGSLLSDSPKWLAMRLPSNARRAVYEHQWKNAFIDAVTCIKFLTTESCGIVGCSSTQPTRVSKARGLRRQLLEVVITHPGIATRQEEFRRAAMEWLSHVYVSRNRIVHSGYSEISHGDVVKAIALTHALGSFLDELISHCTLG